MSLLKITNENRKNVQITSNVRELLVNENDYSLIKISDIKKLFVECGGSPFSYLITYNDGKWGREGWEESCGSHNFYHYYDNDKSIDGLDESELSEKMINDCLNDMNYPSIGDSVFKKLTDTKFKNDKLSETYIPFSLVMDLFSIETGCDYYIVGCNEDINEIREINLNCMDYFEEME
jgi:hypothetical protein